MQPAARLNWWFHKNVTFLTSDKSQYWEIQKNSVHVWIIKVYQRHMNHFKRNVCKLNLFFFLLITSLSSSFWSTDVALSVYSSFWSCWLCPSPEAWFSPHKAYAITSCSEWEECWVWTATVLISHLFFLW